MHRFIVRSWLTIFWRTNDRRSLCITCTHVRRAAAYNNDDDNSRAMTERKIRTKRRKRIRRTRMKRRKKKPWMAQDGRTHLLCPTVSVPYTVANPSEFLAVDRVHDETMLSTAVDASFTSSSWGRWRARDVDNKGEILFPYPCCLLFAIDVIRLS